MHSTGLATLDHAPQVVAEWLNVLQRDLCWTDRDRAYRLLRATLHAIRDFLSVEDAAGLGAQLPLLIRGIFYEGWKPAHTPAHARSVDDFLELAMRPFGEAPPLEPDIAVQAVFRLLRQKIGRGEYAQMAEAMRHPLRDLWM